MDPPFSPDFRMDISRSRLMVVMRSSNSSWRSFISFFNYFVLFSQLFFGKDIFSTTASSWILLFVLFHLCFLSLVLFVVSCNDGDGTTSDTICRPGCLHKRPPDDNPSRLNPSSHSYRPSHLLLDEPERSPPTSTQAASYPPFESPRTVLSI